MMVELSPRGTRGAGFPNFPAPVASLFTGLNVALFRLFGQRMRVMGRPLLLLTTVGARTGKVRQTPLGWFPDDRDYSWLVVAARAGSAQHPSWCVNIAKNPDRVWVEVGKRKVKVRPTSLRGAERGEAWRRVISLSPGYGEYQRKTDREIPLIRLSVESWPNVSPGLDRRADL
jgi:deazaflavin-dependent oxidoreductase (nitroreductase family)